MVAIRPFRALRYHPTLIPNLSEVIAPPYDVIGEEEQEQLYNSSPYNIVRLILGKQSPMDTEQDNRYTRAHRDFTTWRTARALAQDPTPALYLIEHTFQDGGRARIRLGVIALLEFQDAAGRFVYRHEATLAAPKADRTKLLDAVPANLSPIFCVYPDEQGLVQRALHEATRQLKPTATATLHGEDIRLWALTDPQIIETMTRHLASVAVLIADGHHRFEVAYARRRQYGALMSYFVSMADPALVVRPIHRAVLGASTPSRDTLRTLCELEPAADLDSLTAWLQADSSQGRFGYAEGRTLFRLRIKPERIAQWLMTPAVPRPLATLDVSLLHGLLLPHLSVNGATVRYTPHASQAILDVEQHGSGSAWLLRGIPLAQIYALASEGFTLPPKSTYFYPKVPSGLTINPF